MKTTFTIAIMLGLSFATKTMAQGPVGAYTFNGNANDVSGRGNTGHPMTYNGFGQNTVWLPELAAGHDNTANSAYYFPTDSIHNMVVKGYPIIRIADSLNDFHFGTKDFSISSWFKYKGQPFTPTIISNINVAQGSGFQLSIYNISGKYFPKFNMNSGSSAAISVLANIVLTEGTWYNYTVTVDRKTQAIKLYINGAQQGLLKDPNGSGGTIVGNDLILSGSDTTVSGSPSGTGYTQIGQTAIYTSTHFANGTLDDIYLYNRLLTPTEVSDIYAGTIPGLGGGSAPAAPSNLTATPQGKVNSKKMSLAWQDNSTNENGFIIYRSSDNTNWTATDSTSSNITTYLDSMLVPSTTYYYKVAAWNGAGVSGFSNTVNATTTAGIKGGSENMVISIYPDPVEQGDIFHIRSLSAGFEFTMFNLAGEKLYSEKSVTSELIVNRTSIPAGLYVYTILSSNGEMATGKIVLK